MSTECPNITNINFSFLNINLYISLKFWIHLPIKIKEKILFFEIRIDIPKNANNF